MPDCLLNVLRINNLRFWNCLGFRASDLNLGVSCICTFCLSGSVELVIPRGLATGTPYSSMGGWEQARLRKVVIVRGRFTIILCFR